MPAISDRQPDTHAAATRLSFILSWRKLVLLFAATLGIATSIEAGRVLLGSNFHTVIEGAIYRGAQPDPARIEALVRDYGVKTIVNLRGCCNPMPWYLDQCRATQAQGIAQEDFCMSAGRLPSASEVRRLIEVLERVEYPIYVHCWRGADRTGLVSALAVLLKTDSSLAAAKRQLSLRYGHVALGRTGQLDDFLRQYEDWLTEERISHSSQTFRRWATDEYDGGSNYRIERFERTSGPPKCGEPIVYTVRLRNTGRTTWAIRPHSVGGLHLGYFLRDLNEQTVQNARIALFEAEVPPGRTIDVTLVVSPIHEPGRYRLMVDMAQGYSHWMFQMGAEPLEEELEIRE